MANKKVLPKIVVKDIKKYIYIFFFNSIRIRGGGAWGPPIWIINIFSNIIIKSANMDKRGVE